MILCPTHAGYHSGSYSSKPTGATDALLLSRKPVIPALTGRYGVEMIARECGAVLQSGIPLLGVCLYPIIDRPDWDHTDYWHHSGLWDADLTVNPPARVLVEPYANALLQAQTSLLEAAFVVG